MALTKEERVLRTIRREDVGSDCKYKSSCRNHKAGEIKGYWLTVFFIYLNIEMEIQTFF
jgi:hypothetical protein